VNELELLREDKNEGVESFDISEAIVVRESVAISLGED